MSSSNLQTVLRENLQPIACQRDFARRFALNPVHIGIFITIALGRILGIIPRELSLMPIWASTIIYTASVVSYLAFVMVVYPYSMRFCAVKRIPFAYHCYLIYLTFVVVFILIFGQILDDYSDLSLYTRFVNRVVFALPFLVLMAYVMGEEASIALFGNAQFYPSWKRYKPPMHPIFQKMSYENVAPIRYIHANSPFVDIVTINGTERLRMPLKEALNDVAEDAGWKVHRSAWVAKNEISDIKYVNGNPKVVLKDGTLLNASREFANHAKHHPDEFADAKLSN